jgi:5-methylcytosine-specific restriction endonuclease McrA
MQLPRHHKLPVNHLAAVFNKTTATYKFYWFISLLELMVERGNTRIPIRDILIRMICNSWYPVNYFKVSFGFFDMLAKNIQEIMQITDAGRDIPKLDLFELLLTSDNRTLNSLINHFDRQVPYRFLSPWFPSKSNKDIVELSSHFSNDCLYRIIETKPKTIEVNKKWINYLLRNYRIFIDFCYWNLTLYLQDKNPNVPDIPNKLIKPMERSPLTRQRKFWRGFLDERRMESEQVFCIYTATPLGTGNFAVEHFIPYSFVSHDLLWNLVPVDPAINASKSNKLPILEQHLDSFSRLQQMGLQAAWQKNPNNKLLEDYLHLGGGISDLVHLSPADFRLRYQKLLSPLVQIAENMGFEYWMEKPVSF